MPGTTDRENHDIAVPAGDATAIPPAPPNDGGPAEVLVDTPVSACSGDGCASQKPDTATPPATAGTGPGGPATGRRSVAPKNGPKRGRHLDVAVIDDEEIEPFLMVNAAAAAAAAAGLSPLSRHAFPCEVTAGFGAGTNDCFPPFLQSRPRELPKREAEKKVTAGGTTPAAAAAVGATGAEERVAAATAARIAGPGKAYFMTSTVGGQLMRSYTNAPAIDWSAFDAFKATSTSETVELTPVQEENVMNVLDKVEAGTGHIDDPLPFVSAFVDKYSPKLRSRSLAPPRPGGTFLILGVITGHRELCRRCLKLGADPNSTKFLSVSDDVADVDLMRHGYSPMFLAVICERLDIIKLLKGYGGNLFVYDRFGRTPLHAAAAGGNPEVIQWLLSEGSPRRVMDMSFRTPGDGYVRSGPEDALYAKLHLGSVAFDPALAGCVTLVQSGGNKDSTAREGCELLPRGASPAAAAAEQGMTEETSTPAAEPVIAAAAPPADQEVRTTSVAVRELCHCGSERPVLHCGCVDDMYARWSLDRMRSRWCPAYSSTIHIGSTPPTSTVVTK